MNIAVVGAGIFGIAGAIELAERGHLVEVFEQGRVPYEAASSTDTSKTIRRFYGRDAVYVELVERAALKWIAWNNRLPSPVYFRTGQLQIHQHFRPGLRIHESWEFLTARGRDIRRLSPADARGRYPQFAYRDDDVCVYDPWGGYIASADAVSGLARLARDIGVAIREECKVTDVAEHSGGVRLRAGGATREADAAVVAAGVWIGRLLPSTGRHIRPTFQEMVFLEPDRSGGFDLEGMPVWAVDPEVDGWYGHPLRSRGWVKIANDLRGDAVDPDAPRVVRPVFVEAVRDFVAGRLPSLRGATVAGTRACLYEDTPDSHFIIDWVPGCRRILVAGGGSGHGFKFGGVLGGLIADALEGVPNDAGDVFRIGRRFE